MSLPVYLFTGPETGERNDEAEKIRAALKKKFSSSDDYVLYASDTRIQDVVAKLRTESLFTPATFIILRGAETIKNKEDISLLAEWIDSVTPSAKNKEPSESSVLVLESDETSVDSKLEKIIPKSNRKIFWEMFEDRKEEWLRNFFRKNGYSLSPDATAAILDLVENNTEALRTECSKFFLCFPAGHEVSTEDVEKILAHNREESAFTLFDAMCESASPKARLENSLGILQKILMTKNANAVMLSAGLVSCFRRLSAWHAIHAESAYPDEISLKSSGFASKKARSQYARAARIWNAGQTAAIVSLIASTDMQIRRDGQTFSETALTLLLYEIIMKNGAYCASYDS